NPALTEPFGLTLLESLACGLPVVTTNDGGPMDIIHNCKGGLLVDPVDPREIARAIRKILSTPGDWSSYSKNGILNTRRFYTWDSHTRNYAREAQTLCRQFEKSAITLRAPKNSIGRRLKHLKYMLITDIDNTLLGGQPEALREFMAFVRDQGNHMGFGVATGRSLDSAREILKIHDIKTPDIIISDVGSRIDYGFSKNQDPGWESHIRKNWKPEMIRKRLEQVPFIRPQAHGAQGPYKLSYYMEPGKDRMAKLHHLLTQSRFQYSLIYSHERYLDILPYRASKGKAIRYLSYKWEIPLSHFLVCGDSGNDAEMLKGDPLGVVVSNYSPELAPLKNAKRIFFASQPYTQGIMEGVDHYQFPCPVMEKETTEP
ncbi:MAG: HAD hydrolase family protein, partial [Desulfobacterales bacterium]|nr:HAD hydrolase family protein [Desulfobacterales bacterium]